MDKRCIIICDSGAGGLGLLYRLSKRLPKENFLYYADYENLPYGNKSIEELKNIAIKNCKKFLPFCPKTIVFACNTLSVSTLGEKTCDSVEVVRVLPKVKSSGKGLLLCTCATAKSHYVNKLKSVNKDLDVLPMDGLAEEVEKYLKTGKEPNLERRLQGVGRDYDFVSLGCTHYQFVKNQLQKIFKKAEFLSGEDDVFEKIVFSVTTFDTLDHSGDTCFIGKYSEKAKFLYNKGILKV